MALQKTKDSHEEYILFPSQINQLCGILRVQSHGFLTNHGFTRQDRLSRPLHMMICNGPDVDHVNLVAADEIGVRVVNVGYVVLRGKFGGGDR